MRGPQTIRRTNGGIATITDSGQRIGNRRVTRTAGTQPGNSELLSCFIVPQKRIRPNFSAEFFRRGIGRIRFWTAFAVTGQKFPSRSFRCLLRFQHCKFGNSAFFSGRARRGPQTIRRIYISNRKITVNSQNSGIHRVTMMAGTQPGNAKLLPLLYCTTFLCFAEACCAGRR